MGSRLSLRRRRDGSLHVQGDPPSEHWLSAGFVSRHLESGELDVTVTLHAVTGDVTYRLVGLAEEDGTPNPTAWHVELED